MKILKNGAYYGQVKTEFRTNDYILSQYSYHIARTDWHYHEDPYFMYLLEGNVYDVNQKREERCSPGTLLFHNWQEKHFNSKHSVNAQGFHIEIKHASLKKFFKKPISAEGSMLIANPFSHILLSKIYHEFRIQDAFSRIGIDSLIISLMDSMEKNRLIKASTPKWLHLLADIVHEENEFNSLKELSHKLGVHPVHISRTFSKHYGCTLSEYIRMVKIKKSIPYILAKNQRLTEVAYKCGFTDQSHFSRTFKFYFGISPSKFRHRQTLKC